MPCVTFVSDHDDEFCRGVTAGTIGLPLRVSTGSVLTRALSAIGSNVIGSHSIGGSGCATSRLIGSGIGMSGITSAGRTSIDWPSQSNEKPGVCPKSPEKIGSEVRSKKSPTFCAPCERAAIPTASAMLVPRIAACVAAAVSDPISADSLTSCAAFPAPPLAALMTASFTAVFTSPPRSAADNATFPIAVARPGYAPAIEAGRTAEPIAFPTETPASGSAVKAKNDTNVMIAARMAEASDDDPQKGMIDKRPVCLLGARMYPTWPCPSALHAIR